MGHYTALEEVSCHTNTRFLWQAAGGETRYRWEMPRTILGLLPSQTTCILGLKRRRRRVLQRAFSGALTTKWRETHMQELLTVMREQAKALQAKDIPDPDRQLSLYL